MLTEKMLVNLDAGGVRTPLVSTDFNAVSNSNPMINDNGQECIRVFSTSGGTQYNDYDCNDLTTANTVCEFDGNSLSPTSKFIFLVNIFLHRDR
jgi:hypothetical protein